MMFDLYERKTMKYSNIILLSDLDGTLFNAQSEVSEENKKAIEHFVANGGRFGVATGRARDNSLRLLTGVPINYYSIFLNGALLHDGVSGENVGLEFLEKEKLVPLIKKCLEKYPTIGILIYLEKDTYFVSPKELSPAQLVKEGKLEGEFVNLEGIMDEEWMKLFFHGEQEELRMLEEDAKALIEEGVVDGIYTHAHYFELLPKDCSKGKMVGRIHQLKNDKDLIYAVGDFYNDVEMIAVADVGIYTANAPEELKEGANRTTVDCNQHAIADVIERIIEEDLTSGLGEKKVKVMQ